MSKKPSDTKSQSERFIETARELGCDEDEAVFEEKLKRIATAKPKSKKRFLPNSGIMARDALVSVRFEPDAIGWLVEHLSEDAIRLLRDRILNGRLELCKAAEIPVNGAQNAIFRLYVRT